MVKRCSTQMMHQTAPTCQQHSTKGKFNPDRKGLYKYNFRFRGNIETLYVKAYSWKEAVKIIDTNFPNHRNLTLLEWKLL